MVSSQYFGETSQVFEDTRVKQDVLIKPVRSLPQVIEMLRRMDMDNLNLKNEPDLGYIFFPATYDDAPGHPRFDVVMHTQPTQRHFDPTNVAFWANSPTYHVEHITIHHPWRDGYRRNVLPGRLIIRDRRNKEVEAFTFGAKVQIHSNESQTICTFTSPAPILHLISTRSAATYFANEAEGFLARYKAILGLDYMERMAEIDPILLYGDCLFAIQEKLTHLPDAYTEEHHHLQQWIPKEIKRLAMEGKRPFFPQIIKG